MQNEALWLESTPEGYRIRIKFMPMTPAEQEKTSSLLKNFKVEIGTVVTEGPISVDLTFTNKVKVQEAKQPVEFEEPKAE